MNCVPIVHRELRVAARKRSTVWLRVAAGTTGIVIGCGALIIAEAQGAAVNAFGRGLFYVLTWILMIAALASGLFLTADCLSEEKREGTLGLVFLTELRGYDVVLGKLMSTSLRAAYGLLSILPILAVTLLMGGVSGALFWKSSLALLNGLFLSIAAGMFVSALSRDSQKALSGTLLLLLLFVVGGPLADLLIAWANSSSYRPFWSASSPAYALATADAWRGSAYWTANLVAQLAAWAMLGAASLLVPRAWQERRRVGAASNRGWNYEWRYGSARRRARLRRNLLECRPVVWLASRERWQAVGIWAVTVLVLGAFAALLLLQSSRESWIIWHYVGGLFTLMLYLWAASQASRFFVEARRGGILELLLATPVAEKEIVRGQWRALVRMFALPVLLLLGVQAAAATLSQLSFQRLAAQVNAVASTTTTNFVTAPNGAGGTTTAPVAGRTNVVSHSTVVAGGTMTVTISGATNTFAAPGGAPALTRAQEAGMAAAATAAAAVSTAANLLALCWFGMWMGMTSRSANQATLKAILFVQVIPWFVIAFASNVFVGVVLARSLLRSGANQPGTWLMWWPLLTTGLNALLAVGKDAGFILWARSKLYSSLRVQAAFAAGQPRCVTLAPRVPSTPKPPAPMEAPPSLPPETAAMG